MRKQRSDAIDAITLNGNAHIRYPKELEGVRTPHRTAGSCESPSGTRALIALHSCCTRGWTALSMPVSGCTDHSSVAPALELLLRLPHPTAAKRLLVSRSLHHFVCSHQRWRRRPRARQTHSSHIRSFRRAALFGLWLRRNDAPTGASVSTLDFRRARRALWHQRGLGRRRPLPQRPCVLQTGLGLGPAVRFERRPRLAWTELDSSRR